MKKNVIEYLLERLSVKFGIIDFTRPAQTAYLYKLLVHMGMPTNIIQESISRLIEGERFYAQNPGSKRISVFKTKDARDAAINSKGYTQVSDSEAERELAKKTKDKVKAQGDDDKTTPRSGPKADSNPSITDIPAHQFAGAEALSKEDEVKNTPDEQRKIDHQTTDSQLNLTVAESRAQAKQKGKKGVGAGTPESRAGEAATHHALRQLKNNIPMSEIKQQLLTIAKGRLNSKTGKIDKTVLTKEWVTGALNCSDYIVNKFGIDNIDEIVWDTPSGRALIDVEGHDTSSDMFVKLTNGERVGISLKLDGKVFILNGGYAKQFSKLMDGLNLDANSRAQIESEIGFESFKTDREIAFSDGISNLIGVLPDVRTELKKYETDSEMAEKHFGPNYRKYLDVLNQSDAVYYMMVQKAKEQTLSGTEMKALSKLAKSNKFIRKTIPEVYSEMRGSEIRLTQNILRKANNDESFRNGLKDIALDGIHVEEILGIHDNPKLDKFVTVYGEEGGAELSPNTLIKLFNLDVLYSELTDLDANNKQSKIDEIRQRIRSMVEFDFKDDARDGIVKIKHEGPPQQDFPLFTIKCRTKPIGDAPTLEMVQTTYMVNALKYGLTTDTWPEKNQKTFYTSQLKELYEQRDDSATDEMKSIDTQIAELESRSGYKRIFNPKTRKYVYMKPTVDAA
jgi:hypothetical protein